MGESNQDRPRAFNRPATVQFIENELPRYHPVFNNPPSHYDPISSQYIPDNQGLNQTLGARYIVEFDDESISGFSLSSSTMEERPPPRPEHTDMKAMQFWDSIFSKAMQEFKTNTETPKGRSNTVYDIREKTKFHEIYTVLNLARDKYENTDGKTGFFKNIRRKTADNITPAAEIAKIATKVLPENSYSTPVLGAVGVLLGAIKIAAAIRNETLKGLDGLIFIFSDVELFLSQFPKDGNIQRASIDLITTTLKAIEQTIGFFISSDFYKAAKTLLLGGEYGTCLLENLGEINTKSKTLMEEALKSYIHEAGIYSHQTQRLVKVIINEQKASSHTLNSIERLLADHVEKQDRLVGLLQATSRENNILRIENTQLRLTSPILYGQFPPPSPQPNLQTMEWFLSRDALRGLLNTPDLDLADTTYVRDKEKELPPAQRVQVEQVIHTEPFREWVTSTSSSKLLIQWDNNRPRTFAEVSPLSIFCASMASMLQNRDRFIAVQWFCGRRIESFEVGQQYIGAKAMIASLVDQLLRQHSFDMRPLCQSVNMTKLQSRDASEMIKLFAWLVRQLPRSITLICIFDGVVLYEREEFINEAFRVFGEILGLTVDASISATIKVLFTSTPGPELFRSAFAENGILNVETLPHLAWAPSEERLQREMGNEYSL